MFGDDFSKILFVFINKFVLEFILLLVEGLSDNGMFMLGFV